jgi:hypothetical protein
MCIAGLWLSSEAILTCDVCCVWCVRDATCVACGPCGVLCQVEMVRDLSKDLETCMQSTVPYVQKKVRPVLHPPTPYLC